MDTVDAMGAHIMFTVKCQEVVVGMTGMRVSFGETWLKIVAYGVETNIVFQKDGEPLRIDVTYPKRVAADTESLHEMHSGVDWDRDAW
jgi:hypothetical protein